MKLAWDQAGERSFETGMDRGVLYIQGVGYPWNGLVSVKERNSSSNTAPVYIDGVKVENGDVFEDFAISVEAFTYPDEFGLCDGSIEINSGIFVEQQPQLPFDLAYRTLIGNDLNPSGDYKIHLVYGCSVVPSGPSYDSIGGSSDPTNFTWDVDTTPPEDIPGFKASTHLIVDTRFITNPQLLSDFEDILYGTDTTAPSLPSPADVVFWFGDWCIVRITDNGDGTWDAEGPDEYFTMLTDDIFQIDYESAVYLDADTYTIESL